MNKILLALFCFASVAPVAHAQDSQKPEVAFANTLFGIAHQCQFQYGLDRSLQDQARSYGQAAPDATESLVSCYRAGKTDGKAAFDAITSRPHNAQIKADIKMAYASWLTWMDAIGRANEEESPPAQRDFEKSANILKVDVETD
ncbi:hypothetical protein [Paraburkholderia acidisoli]|uniref:Type VI secretion system (T6SS) amidase immunity protein Tai4 n=1 Tax=Paraburkholderia acidisoli TaxID=2571748 RepID=A0A7Z2GIK1_9BURK|nr:hypothetical protein [Paraburkholderia acidisoli]QGZ62472.1 hypothetical protein FAZ98_12450 [Paraburkholderia acidisoli]